MSAALVRQALEFVDPDESSKGKKRGTSSRHHHQGATGQVRKPFKAKLKKQSQGQDLAERKQVEQTVKKLLKTSRPTVSTEIAEKIVERAVKRKAIADVIPVDNEPQKSILFSDEEDNFDTFEDELFCS